MRSFSAGRSNCPPAKRGKGRPVGSQNRYTGALKELFLLAAENVGDRTKIGEKGERHGDGGALAFLEVCAIEERKTFLTVMARLLPITSDCIRAINLGPARLPGRPASPPRRRRDPDGGGRAPRQALPDGPGVLPDRR